MGLGRFLHRPKKWPPPLTHEEAREFWGNPPPDEALANQPADYLEGRERSDFVVSLIQDEGIPETASVFEVGCNVGRNLQALWESGYRNLAAVEINRCAIELMRSTFPEMAAATTIYEGAVEDVLPTLPDEAFDVVFSLAVLVHLHPDSDAVVHPNIARLCQRLLVTVEAEGYTSHRHWDRNYRDVFEPLGFRQVREVACGPLGIGLDRPYRARVFARDGGAARVSQGEPFQASGNSGLDSRA